MKLLVCFLLKLMCTVDDLKEMGIPLGPRKKIANFVKHKAVKLVRMIPAPKRKQNSSVTSPLTVVEVCINTILVRPAVYSLPQDTLVEVMEAQTLESARTGFKFHSG